MSKKNAIITGAGRGIGRACALLLAQKGYRLAICCRNHKEELEEVQNAVRNYGVDCFTFQGDISNYEAAGRFIQSATDTLGSPDLLINNAGISHIGLLQDMLPEEWDSVIRTNLTSVFNTCHHIIPHMLKNHSGKIINLSSVWGNCGASMEVAYSASKGGINAFTKALAKELGPSGIQVNALACGIIDTKMNACFSAEELQTVTDEIPMGRMGSPEETAQMILQLATAPDYLTGQVITMDGGWI